MSGPAPRPIQSTAGPSDATTTSTTHGIRKLSSTRLRFRESFTDEDAIEPTRSRPSLVQDQVSQVANAIPILANSRHSLNMSPQAQTRGTRGDASDMLTPDTSAGTCRGVSLIPLQSNPVREGEVPPTPSLACSYIAVLQCIGVTFIVAIVEAITYMIQADALSADLPAVGWNRYTLLVTTLIINNFYTTLPRIFMMTIPFRIVEEPPDLQVRRTYIESCVIVTLLSVGANTFLAFITSHEIDTYGAQPKSPMSALRDISFLVYHVSLFLVFPYLVRGTITEKAKKNADQVAAGGAAEAVTLYGRPVELSCEEIAAVKEQSRIRKLTLEALTVLIGLYYPVSKLVMWNSSLLHATILLLVIPAAYIVWRERYEQSSSPCFAYLFAYAIWQFFPVPLSLLMMNFLEAAHDVPFYTTIAAIIYELILQLCLAVGRSLIAKNNIDNETANIWLGQILLTKELFETSFMFNSESFSVTFWAFASICLVADVAQSVGLGSMIWPRIDIFLSGIYRSIFNPYKDTVPSSRPHGSSADASRDRRRSSLDFNMSCPGAPQRPLPRSQKAEEERIRAGVTNFHQLLVCRILGLLIIATVVRMDGLLGWKCAITCRPSSVPNIQGAGKGAPLREYYMAVAIMASEVIFSYMIGAYYWRDQSTGLRRAYPSVDRILLHPVPQWKSTILPRCVFFMVAVNGVLGTLYNVDRL
ncbi:hypothetical protein SeLEV6574_g00947 [Synchytrium endobioticum]|nr:hypothetical protein SeLEV6574_g00947 [Synchytrium endobioticum]